MLYSVVPRIVAPTGSPGLMRKATAKHSSPANPTLRMLPRRILPHRRQLGTGSMFWIISFHVPMEAVAYGGCPLISDACAEIFGRLQSLQRSPAFGVKLVTSLRSRPRSRTNGFPDYPDNKSAAFVVVACPRTGRLSPAWRTAATRDNKKICATTNVRVRRRRRRRRRRRPNETGHILDLNCVQMPSAVRDYYRSAPGMMKGSRKQDQRRRGRRPPRWGLSPAARVSCQSSTFRAAPSGMLSRKNTNPAAYECDRLALTRTSHTV